MKTQIISRIQADIDRLGQYSRSTAELAQGQLMLLEQTKASLQDYLDFSEDVRGAVRVFEEN